MPRVEAQNAVDAIFEIKPVLDKTEKVTGVMLARLDKRDTNNLYFYDALMKVKVLANLLDFAISDLIQAEGTVRWPDG